MPTKKIPFGKPYPTVSSVELRDGVAAGCVNGYQDELLAYVKRPGNTLRATIGESAAVQSLYETNSGIVLAVCNGKVFDLSSGGTLSSAYTGTAFNTSNPVSFAEDGTASVVYAANGGKILRINTSARTVTALGTDSPGTVTSLVFVLNNLLSNGLISGGVAGDVNFSIDKQNNYDRPNSWAESTAGGTFNNEAHPDGCTLLWTDFEEVYAGGPSSIEVVWNDGTTPWAKIPGVNVQRGVYATYSLVQFDRAYMFLSVIDKAFRVMQVPTNARNPEAVSSPYDSVIQTLTDHANVKAWGPSVNGKRFYVITWPADGFTLAYNLQEKQWSQWGLWDGTSANGRHLMNCYLFAKSHNKHYVGDYRANGRIYTMTGLTDNSTLIDFQFTSGNQTWGTDRLKPSSKLQFRVKRGQATDTSEPKFTAEFRDDGARRFKRPKPVSLGFANEDEFYADLNGLGSYRSRQYRVRHQDTKSDFVLASMEETFEVAER